MWSALLVVFAASVVSGAVPPRKVAMTKFPTNLPGWTVLGGAAGTGTVLLMNDDKPNLSAGAFLNDQVWLDQWNMTVLFSLAKGANDTRGGFAIVVQGDRLGAFGDSNAGLGYGATPDFSAGLKKSVAVEFDLFNDPGVDDTVTDCLPPHLTVHCMDADVNSAIEKTAQRKCFNGITNPYNNTQQVHNITINYSNKLLSVRYDDIAPVIMQADVDVALLKLTDSLGFIGFTSSTGPQGGDVHMVNAVYFEYYSALAQAKSTQSGLVDTTAGSLNTVTIQAVDEFGHPYPFGGSVVTAAMTLAKDQFTFNVTDGNNGVYTMVWNSTFAAADSMAIILDGIPISGSPFAVAVAAVDVDPKQCNTSGTTTYGLPGAQSDFTINVFDRFRNPTPLPVSFAGSTLKGAAGEITIQGLTDPTVLAPGVYGLSFVPSLVGAYKWNLLANGVRIGFMPPDVQVAAGPPVAAKCSVVGAPAAFAVGQPQTFQILLRDSQGNTFSGNTTVDAQLVASPITWPIVCVSNDEGTYNCQFMTTQAATWSLSVLVLGVAVTDGVPPSVVSQPGPVSQSASKIVSPSATVVAGTAISTVLQVVDQYGNAVPGVVNWAVSINAQTYAAKPDTTDGTGYWTVAWQPTLAARYVMTATIDGVPVQGSGTYAVVVTPLATPDVSKTQVSGVGFATARVNVQALFWVVVEDMFGNVITTGTTVNVAIVKDVATPQPGDSIAAQANYDATNTTWVVSYTPTEGGRFRMQLSIGSQLYGGAPQILQVSGGGGISGGIIAAIVLSCVAGIALVVGVVLLLRRRHKKYQSI